VVVDNASEQPPGDTAGALVVRTQERLSTGAARNLGLSHVETEFVLCLDADDLILPGGIEFLEGLLAADPSLDAAVGLLIEGPTGRPHRVPRRTVRLLARRGLPLALASALWPAFPTQGATLIRTSAIRALGGYPDLSRGEEWELSACLAGIGTVVLTDRPVALYRLDIPPPSPAPGTAARRHDAARVRARLRREPGVRSGVRIALPAIALTQVLAILVARPLARGLRHLRRGEEAG
jgi:hypothetical protein